VSLKGGTVATEPPPAQRTTSTLAFSLVVIMLGVLFFLVGALLFLVGWSPTNTVLVDYSKWALTTLLGTFGAWIGAGAAYLFGKENLAESSRSTEAALSIQQKALQGAANPERIRELALTAFDKDFIFNPDATKKDVIDRLNKNNDYWWVPVVDQGGKGILEDIIHARVFWDDAFTGAEPISKIVTDIDTKTDLKTKYNALHGASFFVKVALDDQIADVIGNMKKSGAGVGVIVDEKGKPTYCFTKQDLLNVQK